MQFIWIFLWFQTMNMLCTAEVVIPHFPRTTLMNVFGYDFDQSPEIGRVIFWHISKDEQTFQPQEYNKYVTKFESNKTYLVFTQTQSQDFSIYYWLGSNVLLNDKKAAAKYLALLHKFFLKYENSSTELMGLITISRETEGTESESFRNTVNFIERGHPERADVPDFFHEYLDSEYVSQYPHQYVVRGDTSTTRIKKVSLSTSWFISDTCLVLESGYKFSELAPLNMYCGASSSEKVIKRAQGFIDKLSSSYFGDRREPILTFKSTNKNDSKFKTFVEVLENSSNYKSYEVDESNDHVKDGAIFVADRDEAVKLFWIKRRTIAIEGTNETTDVLEKYEDNKRPVFNPRFIYKRETGIGFIFDSSSIAGVFVHTCNANSIGEIVAMMELVEDYIEEKYSSSSRPPRVRIRNNCYYYGVIDFLINMISWPANNEM